MRYSQSAHHIPAHARQDELRDTHAVLNMRFRTALREKLGHKVVRDIAHFVSTHSHMHCASLPDMTDTTSGRRGEGVEGNSFWQTRRAC